MQVFAGTEKTGSIIKGRTVIIVKTIAKVGLAVCALLLIASSIFAQDFTVGNRMSMLTMTSTTEWKSWTATEDLVNLRVKPVTGYAYMSTTTDASAYWNIATNEVVSVGESSKMVRGSVLYFNTTQSVPATIEMWGQSFSM